MTNLSEGDIIKHKAFKDVCFGVNSINNKDGFVEITGKWINQGFNKTYDISPVPFEKITIKEHQINNWYKVENPNAECVRYENWINIGG